RVMIHGTRGVSSGPRPRRHRNTTLRGCPKCAVAARSGTSNIRKTRTGSTNRPTDDEETAVTNEDAITIPSSQAEWRLPSRRKMAVACLIITETAMFTIFVVAYLFYLGKSLTGPYPNQVLETPILSTICLLGSSLTIVFAERALRQENRGRFQFWWMVTIFLAAVFLGGTA